MKAMRWTVALGLAAVLAVPAAATVLVVDDDGFDCPNALYQRISDAVDAAGSGDTINICAGIYREQVVVTKPLKLRGEPSVASRAVIQPLNLPATRPSLFSGGPVTAGILVDQGRVLIESIDVDVTQTAVAGCSPILAGIYLRNASGVVTDTHVQGTRVLGNPSCDSGVGLLIEGDGGASSSSGRVRVVTLNNVYRDYQRVGMVATGPGVVVKDKGSQALGSGLIPDTVQIGFQLSRGAFGTLKNIVATGHATSRAGKMGSGVVLDRVPRSIVRRATISDGQTGIFVNGDQARIKGNHVVNMSSDGMVILGARNLVIANLIQDTVVSGAFVDGDRNVIRGGAIANSPIGIWLYPRVNPQGEPYTNLVGAVDFTDVITQVQGVAGGARELTGSIAGAFLEQP